MNKITSLFSIAGLLALTACTVDPVTDINAMEEAVLARQNELAAQSTTNSTYSEESENESDEDDDDAQSGGENEGYEGSAEGDSSNDESGEAEGADDAEQNEQNEQNEQDEAADQSDNSGTQEGDADQAADGDTEQESASSGGNASESNDDDSSAQQTTGGVPSGVAATAWTAIQSYISQHFNAASVVEVEQEDGEIEVKLNSGHEVYFTLSGNYIRTEN